MTGAAGAVVGPDDAGRTVDVPPGGELTLALPQIAGTGYRWALDPLPDGYEVVAEHSATAGSPSWGMAPGAGSLRLITVRVGPAAHGPVVLRARLRRPWEAADTDSASFEVTVSPDRRP